MIIRKAVKEDISQLVEIDKAAYGAYGADSNYFKEKFKSNNASTLVVEEENRLTGFIVSEIMKKDEIPSDFTDLNIENPIADRWLHIIAFTTKTNYLDVTSDTRLLKEVEKLTKEQGINIFCVPLSIDHPFSNHGVFKFWEENGYKKIGTIQWVASPEEKIPCYFYLKRA